MNKTVDIYYREKPCEESAQKYIWAYAESFRANIFGRAHSLGEIRSKAVKMFPQCEINLIGF